MWPTATALVDDPAQPAAPVPTAWRGEPARAWQAGLDARGRRGRSSRADYTVPDRTVVVRFDMRDRPAEQYWLLLRKPHPELCSRGFGFVEDMVAGTDSA